MSTNNNNTFQIPGVIDSVKAVGKTAFVVPGFFAAVTISVLEKATDAAPQIAKTIDTTIDFLVDGSEVICDAMETSRLGMAEAKAQLHFYRKKECGWDDSKTAGENAQAFYERRIKELEEEYSKENK